MSFLLSETFVVCFFIKMNTVFCYLHLLLYAVTADQVSEGFCRQQAYSYRCVVALQEDRIFAVLYQTPLLVEIFYFL